MAIMKKLSAKKPRTRRFSTKSEVILFTTPLRDLTLNNLLDAGVCCEKSKQPPFVAVHAELSVEDIARIAKAVAEISQKRREG